MRYDTVIFGATPSGIVAAIRLAREGRSVLLVSAYERIGGMLSNGLSMMDALYKGWRSPLYAELLERLHDVYATRYEPDSSTTKATTFGVPDDFNKRPRFETAVMRDLLADWVAQEPGISLLKPYYVADVRRDGGGIRDTA